MKKILLILVALLATTSVCAEDFVNGVVLIGGTKSETNYLKSELTADGWILVDYDLNKVIYEKVPALTLDDVIKFQQTYVKDKPHTIGILGRKSDMDLKTLSQYGKIQEVKTEEIFGY